MNELTYTAIESLVESADVQGPMMKCVFKCAKSGKTVPADVNLDQLHKDSIMSNAKATAQDRLARSFKRTLFGLVGQLMGRGTGGVVARQIAGQAFDKVAKNRIVTKTEREAAIVAAFEKCGAFVKDSKTQSWVHKESVEKEGEASGTMPETNLLSSTS